MNNQTDDHGCPRCGRTMQSDFDQDVGMWYECHECDSREAVSNVSVPSTPDQAASEAAEEIAERWMKHDLPERAKVQSLSLIQLRVLAEEVISKQFPTVTVAPSNHIRKVTWNQAIKAASSVDLYHHPTTNPDHDSLKSAQEVRDEIVRVLEVRSQEKFNE